MPTSSVGPLGPYDLILQDKASSPSTTVGLMLDLDNAGAPRVREFRVPPVPPRQSQGFLADSSLDPMVDYIYVQDDWSGGAIRPYYREGDRRYAEADDVDARWEGVLALGMKYESQSIVLDNAGWETGAAGAWTLTGGSLGGTSAVSTSAVRTGTYGLRLVQAASGTASSARIDLYPQGDADGTAWRNRTIRFGCWARSTATGTNIGDIQVVDNGSSNTITYISGMTADTWTFFTVTHTFSATTTSARISIQTSDSGGRTIDIDDMVLQVGNTDTAVGIVEAAGKYYMAIGPLILVLDTDASPAYWTTAFVHADGTQATSIISYKNKVYVGYGLASAYYYGTASASPATTDWTAASGGSAQDTYAQFFTVQDDRLWKNETANVLRYSTTDPASATSWGVKYIAGEVSAPITGMYMLNHAIVVGTETGLHTWFEDELRFRNVTNQFLADPDTSNFKQGIVRGSWLYLTTAKQGLIRFNGYAIEDLSELFMAPRLTTYGGRVRALTQDQHQLYLLVDTPTVDTSLTKTTRLMSLRNVGGEWQLHTLSNIDIADINSLSVAGNYLYGMGRMSFGTAGQYYLQVIRFKLPEKSAAPFQDDISVRELITTGTINLPVFHAAGVAALIKCELLVEDTDANNTVAVKFGIDGAAPSTTTLGTITTTTTTTPAKVTLNASSLTTPTDAQGRFWQFQLVLTRDSTQAAGAHESPKVYAFVAHFVLAPTPVPAWEVYVRLMQPLKNGMQDPRSKTAILTDLNTLETQAYPITLVEDFSQDNSENSHYVRIRNWERVLEDPEVHKGRPAQAGELYQLTLQKII